MNLVDLKKMEKCIVERLRGTDNYTLQDEIAVGYLALIVRALEREQKLNSRLMGVDA